MILLRANNNLKAVFLKMINTMGENVKWTEIFIVNNNDIILAGKGKSLFFNFDNKRVAGTFTEIPINEEKVELVPQNSLLENTLNMILYAFGKWGGIKGLKVETNYDQLNRMLKDVLFEIDTEASLTADNFRFFKEGVRITYEEVIQAIIDKDKASQIEEENEDATDEDDTQNKDEYKLGLWHNMQWTGENYFFEKEALFPTDRSKPRIGNGFYIVGYNCPECGEKLHMVVYPEGKEFRIETEGEAVYMSRAYTCNICNTFYTPKPHRLIIEGDIFCLDFDEDRNAYEDYLELLGERGEKTSNGNFNEYESAYNRKGLKEPERLEEVCDDMESLSEEEIEEIRDKMDSGFYPSRSVERYSDKVDKEIKTRKKSKKDKEEKDNKQDKKDKDNKQDKKDKENKANKDINQQTAKGQDKNKDHDDGRDNQKTGKNQNKNKDHDDGKDNQKSTEGQNQNKDHGKDQDQENDKFIEKIGGNDQADNFNVTKAPSDENTVNVKAQKNESEVTKKTFITRTTEELKNIAAAFFGGDRKYFTGEIENISPKQLEELKVLVISDKEIDENEKKNCLEKIDQVIYREKQKELLDKAVSLKGKIYSQMIPVIKEIQDDSCVDSIKKPILKSITEMLKKRGENELENIISRIPQNVSRKQYKQISEIIGQYSEVDISMYKKYLDEKRDAVEKLEITEFIRKSNAKDRNSIYDVYGKLLEQDFEERNVGEFRDKLYEKVTLLDEAAIKKIIPDPADITFEEGLRAYDKISAGVFLPELKANMLAIIDKRLMKMKMDECEQLTGKLGKELRRAVKDFSRIHIYNVRKMLREKPDDAESVIINNALNTYAVGRGKYEYPILICNGSFLTNLEEGFVLTEDHIFYKGLISSGMIDIIDIKNISAGSGLLHKGIYVEHKRAGEIKIANNLKLSNLSAFVRVLKEFVDYLQEKPESRNIEYMAIEKHNVKCCYRCGYVYKEGNVCPKCGGKFNE